MSLPHFERTQKIVIAGLRKVGKTTSIRKFFHSWDNEQLQEITPRHSIAHSHLIISVREVHEGKTVSIQEYLKVNYKQQTFERFQERPSTLFLEMLLIATIFTQILVLYQLLFQDKQLKNGIKEVKPGSIVKL